MAELKSRQNGRQARIKFVILILAVLSTGVLSCTAQYDSTPGLTATGASETTSNCPTPIDASNARKVSELFVLSPDGANPIAAISFTSNEQILLAVHSSKNEVGKIIRWHLSDRKWTNSISLHSVNVGGTRFSKSGKNVVVFRGNIQDVQELIPNNDIAGVQVWDSYSGVLLAELLPSASLWDAAMSPDLGRVLAVSPTSGIMVRSVRDGEDSFGLIYFNNSTEGVDKPTVTAFDSRGEVLAYALDNGTVGIGVWKDHKINGAGRIYSDGNPLDLAFDYSSRWLGILRETSVEIRDLRFPLYLLAVTSALEPSKMGRLSFNPSGNLLGLVHGTQWQLRQTRDLGILAQGSGDLATAIAFSEDGCFLAWGDVKGQVHLLGISNP